MNRLYDDILTLDLVANYIEMRYNKTTEQAGETSRTRFALVRLFILVLISERI